MNDDQALFDGVTFDPDKDGERLGAQARQVWSLMRDGAWRTLRDIATAIGAPEASVSARLRDFRKDKWGGMVVERRRRGEETRGLWEYRVIRSAA
jgi:hypothetical protein